MALVSPGTEVNLIDESFFFPGNQTSIPLIFIATGEQKTQPDGTSPALGTYEYNVARVVTSRSQSLELYGTPKFFTDAAGNPHHGDARNEYGLDALNKFLQIGSSAIVVRVNVNLDDDYASIKTLWTNKISDAADNLNGLVADFIEEFNEANNLVPADAGYKQSVTASELKPLVDEALADVFACYSFSGRLFEEAFIQDHTQTYAGYQEAIFDDTSGNITAADATGLNNDTTTYGFDVEIVNSGGTDIINVRVDGQDAQTFGELVTQINNDIAAVIGVGTYVEIISGNIRITSDLESATSSVEVQTDGPSGTTALFANLNLFTRLADPVSGKGANPLDVYNDTFATIVDTYDGIDALIDNWTSGSVVTTEFTPSEAEGLLVSAAAEFDNTKEFRNLTSLGTNDAARRSEIVKQIRASISNPDTLIRSGQFSFNLVATPGYWEPTTNLVALSQELKEEVFVVADTPLGKPPTGPNSILAWEEDNKVVSRLVAYYYPHGLSSNTDGATIMTSAASSALRVYALNDQRGELWYAPAGPERGVSPHLSAIGYASGTLGSATTFVKDDIDQGTRDVLFIQDINTFTRVQDRGILVLAQNTTQASASALDRVNVSRLAAFIRRELRKRLFDYLFLPNDEITRENVKAATDSFLGELLSRRGLFDFATQVNDTNNTPATIDNSELNVDIAIKPTRAVEFVNVDLRVVRTDAEIGS